MLAWEHCRYTLQDIRRSMMPKCESLDQLSGLLQDRDGFAYKSFGVIRGTAFFQASIPEGLIFANMELVAELPDQFRVGLDGTFGIVPFNAEQLLVVMAELRHKMRPVIYAVLTGFSTAHYQAILGYARDHIFNFDGQQRTLNEGISDFEQAMRNALVIVWPNLRRTGCNFHYKQALRRRANKFPSINTQITGRTEHHKVLLMYMALSLLPLNRIAAGIDAIETYVPTPPPLPAPPINLAADFAGFRAYFNDTWMNRYPQEDWCVSDRNRRTNNNLEGYNNKIKSAIPKNPSPWIFLEALVNLAFDASASFDSDKLRNAPPPADRSLITEPLNIALEELNNGAIDELAFLERLALRSWQPQEQHVQNPQN